ncbi:MAG: hypothetical protein AAF251_05345 [Pseudomonadota bacterium]
MTKRKPTSKERYEELMRNAGEKKRALRDAALEREREFRKAAEQRARQARTASGRLYLSETSVIEAKIEAIIVQLKRRTTPGERRGLRAELAQLRELIVRLRADYRRRRKPPESGLPVPAVPPGGPLPKQGGAAAPLDFGAD